MTFKYLNQQRRKSVISGSSDNTDIGYPSTKGIVEAPSSSKSSFILFSNGFITFGFNLPFSFFRLSPRRKLNPYFSVDGPDVVEIVWKGGSLMV